MAGLAALDPPYTQSSPSDKPLDNYQMPLRPKDMPGLRPQGSHFLQDDLWPRSLALSPLRVARASLRRTARPIVHRRYAIGVG